MATDEERREFIRSLAQGVEQGWHEEHPDSPVTDVLDMILNESDMLYDMHRETLGAMALGSALVTVLAEVERLREIVEAVAEAAVGDEYGGGSWLMFAGYDAETVRTKARALIAHPTKE